MSGDGKMIVYEENFGIWKLDVASGRSTEIKIQIATDDKENEFDVVTRAERSRLLRPLAVGPARGHLGARADPDHRDEARRHHARRARSDGVAQPVAEVVARRQVDRVPLRSLRPRRNLDHGSGRQGPKQITDLDNEKGAFLWSPDSRRCCTRPPTRSSTATRSPTRRRRVSPRTRSRASARSRLTRQQMGRVHQAGPDAALARLHRAHWRRRGAPHLRRRAALLREQPVWTADGRYLVFTSSEGSSNGIASQGGIATTTELWAVPLRDQDRDPLNRDIDNEAQALAAQAAAGAAGGARRRGAPVTVQIDWGNWRGARGRFRCPAMRSAGSSRRRTGAPSHSICRRRGGRGAAPRPASPASTS